ncbi:MAG: peptidoglycan-binding protein [Saprospiraceae bacterium]|nr:peptidoglycan-binding protein [Saprospiraceae bacterium]
MKSLQPNNRENVSKAAANQLPAPPQSAGIAPPPFLVTASLQLKEETADAPEVETAGLAAKMGAGEWPAGRPSDIVMVNPVALQSTSGMIQTSSFRFDQEPVLLQVAAGARNLSRGDRGLPVSIVQQGLSDAGFPLPAFGVDAIFESETETAVKGFQTGHGLPDTGVVDAATLHELDVAHDIDTTRPEIGMATAHQASNPLAGTRSISAAERRAFQQAIVTEPRTSTGASPTFQPNIPAGNYQDRILAALTNFIDRDHARFVSAQARRTQPGGLEAWAQIEAVAQAGKRVTDQVFGSYRSGPAFRQGTNLSDAWEQESQHIAADPSYASFIAEDVLDAYLGYSPIASEPGSPGINEQHGAVPSRSRERGIINTVKQQLLRTRRQDLLDIQINWPGLADAGVIAVQRTTSSDAAVNRDRMWDLFSTCIHEYIHTLEHRRHIARRSRFSEHRGNRALREGSTDYFTAIVWNSLNFTPALRQEVEGPYHDPAIQHPIHPHGRYGETANAARAAGIVGFHNMAAAFFLGEVNLIG